MKGDTLVQARTLLALLQETSYADEPAGSEAEAPRAV